MVTESNHSGAAQAPPPNRETREPQPTRAPGEPAAGPPPVSPPAAWPAGEISPEAGSADSGSPDSEEAPSFWDWAPPDDPVDDLSVPEPASAAADPPKAAWKLVVTPAEPVVAEPEKQGIGQRWGNLTHLSAHPRMRIWRWRILAAIVVGVALAILVSWQLGLTLAVVVVIADTIYRSRRAPGAREGKMTAAQRKVTGAQRQTRKQLAKLGRAGYRALHFSLIPESEEQIDHLVVGPAGVFAIDSEAWDKRLVVRTRNARQLWHGPFSMKERLEHARWESQRASELLSGAIGSPVTVRPAMAVYGPKIPWDVATIREVDVFSGPRLRKYLRRRARQEGVRPLSDAEVERIYTAANQAFPHLAAAT
jgi:hypothetical protein